MTRLGGWWRLWIAASVVWVALTGGLTLSGFPTRASVVDGMRRDASDLAKAMADRRVPEADVTGLPRKEALSAILDVAEQEIRLEETILDSLLGVGTTEGEARMASATRKAQLETLESALPFVLGPPLGLLLLGLTARWIWRGFAGAAALI